MLRGAFPQAILSLIRRVGPNHVRQHDEIYPPFLSASFTAGKYELGRVSDRRGGSRTPALPNCDDIYGHNY